MNLLYTPILTAYIGRKTGKENTPWKPLEQIRRLMFSGERVVI
jgi:hypothetical protein